MADDLLLRTSLQRERDEIARLQGQLQQQSIQQQPPPNSPTIGDPQRRSDLAEQQRRLAMLQQQQQQFQRQMLVHQQQRQQLVGHALPSQQQPTFATPNPPIPLTVPTTTASLNAATAAFLLAQHQQQQQQSANTEKLLSPPIIPFALPNAFAHQMLFAGCAEPAKTRTPDSPCPTPAYHYQLAAPKPSAQHHPALGLHLMELAQQAAAQLGVDVRPADSTIATPPAGSKEKGAAAAEQIRARHTVSNMLKKTPQKTQQPSVSLNRSQPKETTTTSPTSGESSPRRKPVPVFQISPQQLHMAMQQFFRSQQQQQSSANVKDETTAESSPTTSPMAGTAGTPASPGKCEVGVQVRAPQNGGDGEAEEYVDVVGDGVEARSSFLKLQRKAHIEFYRKLKSFRNRGDQLDCQICQSPVPNSDASIRSHVHGHCKTALFVCKLCQRGFQDQHLVFEHIKLEHPTKGAQFIEDRRDMAILMDLLNECFPKVLCRARDCLFEAIGRLTAWAQCHGEAELECRLCAVQVQAQKNALYGHLNVHPSYKCKKCKFSCTEERAQLEHQRREHPGTLVAATDNNNKDRVYCVSLAFDVLLETLKCCFPLNQISGSQSPSAVAKGDTKKEEGKPKEEPEFVQKKLKRKSASMEEANKREKKETPKRRCRRAKSYNLGERGEEEGSWTEED